MPKRGKKRYYLDGRRAKRSVVISRLLPAQNYKCPLCGEKINPTLSKAYQYTSDYPSIDHIVPRSRGGSDDAINLQITHRGCNMRKGNGKPSTHLFKRSVVRLDTLFDTAGTSPWDVGWSWRSPVRHDGVVADDSRIHNSLQPHSE